MRMCLLFFYYLLLRWLTYNIILYILWIMIGSLILTAVSSWCRPFALLVVVRARLITGTKSNEYVYYVTFISVFLFLFLEYGISNCTGNWRLTYVWYDRIWYQDWDPVRRPPPPAFLSFFILFKKTKVYERTVLSNHKTQRKYGNSVQKTDEFRRNVFLISHITLPLVDEGCVFFFLKYNTYKNITIVYMFLFLRWSANQPRSGLAMLWANSTP